jgi:hypothetical protein
MTLKGRLKKWGEEKEKCVVRLATSSIRVAGQLAVKTLCSCSQKTLEYLYGKRGVSLQGKKYLDIVVQHEEIKHEFRIRTCRKLYCHVNQMRIYTMKFNSVNLI